MQFAWQAYGWYTGLSIFSSVYSNTLYPLIQMVLLARVIDLLTHGNSVNISNFLWIGLAYAVASLLNYYLANYNGLKQPYFQNKLEFYLDRVIIRKLASLDPATFEQAKFQSMLSQISGTVG